jgi:hypothetical protein
MLFIHTHPFFFNDPYFNERYKELLYNEQPKYFIADADKDPPGEILDWLTAHYRIVQESATFKLYERG